MTEIVTPAIVDNKQATASAAPQVAVEVQVGQQLETARKALQISVIEVAQRLRLGEKQVLALETGELAALPGKTFVRGFVRNYARVVQIDPEPLLHLLDNADKLSAPKLELHESTHVAMPEQGRGVSRDLLTVVAGLLLVAIAAALYFFLPEQWIASFNRQEQNAQPEQENQSLLENGEILPEDSGDETMPSEQTNAPATATNSANPAAPASVPQPPATPKPPAPQPATPASVTPKPTSTPAATSAAPAAAPTAASGTARAHLAFSDASWVEVRDKNGKAISSGQHPAGTQHEVAGEAPLTVIIGRASGVQLRYQGQPVTLRPNPDSDIARVVLP